MNCSLLLAQAQVHNSAAFLWPSRRSSECVLYF